MERPTVIPRRKSKQKKNTSQKVNYDVQIIPAKKSVCTNSADMLPKKRVAAYCRVSTDDEAQASSYDLQVDYYTKLITDREDWELVDVYADEGISGTQTRHRDNFNRMIEDCEAGKIDMIITKSISRFARNVVDCISTIRTLKDRPRPISVYFEKEHIDSLDEKMEVFLTMMASFAQEESRSISTNVRWAIIKRMKDGTQKVQTSALYGYDTDEDGNMIIIDEEAAVVRTIYSPAGFRCSINCYKLRRSVFTRLFSRLAKPIIKCFLIDTVPDAVLLVRKSASCAVLYDHCPDLSSVLVSCCYYIIHVSTSHLLLTRLSDTQFFKSLG